MKQETRMGVSVLCGLVAAVALAIFLHQSASASERAKAQLLNRFGGTTVEVLVAQKDIHAGEKIDASLFFVQEWPSILLPDDPVLKSEQNRAIGHSANTLVLAGEPLRLGRIDEAVSVLESVAVGMQAVTIPTDPVRAIGGQVRVGMRVDLLCPDTAGNMEVLAREVMVLALSTEGDADSGETNQTKGILGNRTSADIRWITLCIDEELVGQIVAAASAGKVYLTYPGSSYEG